MERALQDQDADAAVGLGRQEEQQQQQQQHPANNAKMYISDEERQLALAIKRAIEEDDELENLTDFQYVQAALTDGDDIEAALERAYHLQAFRQEYNIRHQDMETATNFFWAFLRQNPGVILSVAYNSDEETYVLIYDMASYDQRKLTEVDEAWRVLVSFVYYEMNALNPDFYSIRKGIVFVIECEGFDWKNLDIKVIERSWREILSVYPTIYRQLKHFHTGVFANLTASLMKRFLPDNISNKIQVGCEYDGRLDTLYLVPSLEAANHRTVDRLTICLRQRYENEMRFRL